MGTAAGSFLRPGEVDDVLEIEYNTTRGVVKRIPIEVKPRGRLGLRSVRSIGKPKGGSLRSALSIDLENPEVERIRKDFEMYRLNKENDLANMVKKVQKLETENRRLRAELQTIQKTCRKLREERDAAIEAEHQALVRASAFESDRDKIQRQFKIFREAKESELQSLLKTRRDLENKLHKVGGSLVLEDTESTSRLEASLGTGNPGDWWTALESEPSLGSTSQLHTMTIRGPEFANTLVEMEGPYHVNKEDWHAAAASLAQSYPTVTEALQTNTIRVYISAPSDASQEVELFCQEYGSGLSKLCQSEGRFCLFVHMPIEETEGYTGQEQHIHARCRQIDQATIFLAFLAEKVESYTESDYNLAYLKNPDVKPSVFCFRNIPNTSYTQEIEDLQKKVKENCALKVVSDYRSPTEGAEVAYKELDKLIRCELGLDQKRDSVSLENLMELEGPTSLCGGSLWDTTLEYEQLESLADASRSTCELGFEKYYEMLNAHVAAPGPLPPLLVSGASGSGRSLLLAKWVELQQHRLSGSLVLYHFVGSETSCSADPLLMIRRLTQQLMQHVTLPPALTCDPVRLLEEFPKWLEKVSSKLAGGVILVLDSIDRFQNGESQLKWLLDPLPVDSRVIVSVLEDTCPQAWRFWPTVHIEEPSNKAVGELLRAELASLAKTISAEQEASILTHCRTSTTCNPLYVVLLASDIARCASEDAVNRRLDVMLPTTDTVQLYKALLECLKAQYENNDTRSMMAKVLRLAFAARNGISESELFELLPALTWNFWAPLCVALRDRHILTYRSGLLVIAHEQARTAILQKFLGDAEGKILRNTRMILRDYFGKNTHPSEVTYRVADELPWLNRQLDDEENLHHNIINLCIFIKLYGRGRCAELISYWQYVGVEKNAMAHAYYEATKQMEEMVGHFDGLVTLPRIADVYEALGRFLRDLGLLTEALIPLQRALEIRETALDPDHPSVARSLHQVAGLHAQQGKLPTAEALYRQALEIYEGAFGRDHVLVAKELDALAVLHQKQGKHDLADPLHKRALAIRKNTKPLRVSSGHIRSIDPLRKRVLRLEELAIGPDSAHLARTLNEIGVLYYLQGNVETAEPFFRRSLEMREAIHGAESSDVAQALNNLAALYNDRKLYDKAEPLYERALVIRRKIYAEEHPSVASVVKHLSMLYKRMGKLEKAEPLYRQMVEFREKVFGNSHPSVATALVNLAVLYSQQGKHQDANPLYEKALKIYEESFGPNHPRVAETLRNLALLKYEQGEFATAAELYKRSTEIKDTDPASALCHSNKLAPRRRSCSIDTTSTLRTNHGSRLQHPF